MKKILFLIITLFMFTGFVYADEVTKNVLIGRGEEITLDPNADAGTTGKTYTYTGLPATSTPGGCAIMPSDGVIKGDVGGANPEASCAVTLTAKASDNSKTINYEITVIYKVEIAKNEGEIVCTGTSTETYIAKGGRYKTDVDPVILRAEPSLTLRDIFPTANIGKTGYNCKVSKEGAFFAGWYYDGGQGTQVDADKKLYEIDNITIHPHWSDTAIAAESIEIEDPYGAGVIALKKGDANANSRRLGVLFKPYYTTTQTVTWSSSDTNVATVDENGIVTAVNNGEATIKAVSTDGNHEATIKVIVNELDANFVLTPENPVIKEGETLTFSFIAIGPTVFPSSNVTFTSSDETIASFETDTISLNSAKIKAHKQGKVTITATIGTGTNATTKTTTLNVADEAGHRIDDLDYIIEFEGGEGAQGSMDPQQHFKDAANVLKLNQFTKEGYVFAYWKVYMVNADGTRVEVKPDGTNQLTYKDGETLSLLNIPEGSKLVLVAEWATNPETGSLAPIAIGALIILGIYLLFVKAREYNKIARI